MRSRPRSPWTSSLAFLPQTLGRLLSKSKPTIRLIRMSRGRSDAQVQDGRSEAAVAVEERVRKVRRVMVGAGYMSYIVLWSAVVQVPFEDAAGESLLEIHFDSE